MSVLSDRSIYARLMEGSLGIDPWTPEQIQPASYDVRLGNIFLAYSESVQEVDPADSAAVRMDREDVADGNHIYLGPGEFALGHTVERVRIPHDLMARVDGKSSLARLGLLIHLTAGNIDPGFGWDNPSQITLELYNAAPVPVKLWPGMLVAHLQFSQLDQPCARPYGHPALKSKYQGQSGATASRYKGDK